MSFVKRHFNRVMDLREILKRVFRDLDCLRSQVTNCGSVAV